MPIAGKVRIIFEYNLESVDKQMHLMRPHHAPSSSSSSSSQADHNADSLSLQNAVADSDVDAFADMTEDNINVDTSVSSSSSNDSTWKTMVAGLWDRLWERKKRSIDSDEYADKRSNSIAANKYDRIGTDTTLDIVNELGDSWELCRPCTDTEMVENFCTSDIGMFACN